MRKLRMCFPEDKRFRDGFEEYILDCKTRNLREGTILHYQTSIKQIYKRIPPNSLICDFSKRTMDHFYIALSMEKSFPETGILPDEVLWILYVTRYQPGSNYFTTKIEILSIYLLN